MSPLSIRIMAALFICALGVTLAACWLVFFEPDAKNNEVRSWLIENVPVLNGLPKPSDLFREGKAQAREDIGEGRYRIMIYAPESPGDVIYGETLSKEYGIEVVNLGRVACLEQKDFTDGYNEVTEAAIEEKHGRYFLENIKYRAEKQAWQEEQTKKMHNQNFDSDNYQNILRSSRLRDESREVPATLPALKKSGQ